MTDLETEALAVLDKVLACPQAAPWLARMHMRPPIGMGAVGEVYDSPTVYQAACALVTKLRPEPTPEQKARRLIEMQQASARRRVARNNRA